MQILGIHVLTHLAMSEAWITVKYDIAFLKIHHKLDTDHVLEDWGERASERVGNNKWGKEGAQIQDPAITQYAH